MKQTILGITMMMFIGTSTMNASNLLWNQNHVSQQKKEIVVNDNKHKDALKDKHHGKHLDGKKAGKKHLKAKKMHKKNHKLSNKAHKFNGKHAHMEGKKMIERKGFTATKK